MKKHAYLIMAHNNFYLLERLLRLIDDERNDIFLHIDKKVRDAPIEQLEGAVQKANLTWVAPIRVHWGGYSQIATEMRLFQVASCTPHQYYHLLSGVDMPLKTQNEIHDFFEKNTGKEFLGVSPADPYLDRVARYHFFTHYLRKDRPKRWLFRGADCLSKLSQRVFQIDRTKKAGVTFYFGANWASMTEGFVQYLLKKEGWIKKHFSHTFCCDEVYKQTILMNSPYRDARYRSALDGDYEGCMRLIDWERSPNGQSPYTFRMSDMDELLGSPRLFARKFDCDVDREVVDALYASICARSRAEGMA